MWIWELRSSNSHKEAEIACWKRNGKMWTHNKQKEACGLRESKERPEDSWPDHLPVLPPIFPGPLVLHLCSRRFPSDLIIISKVFFILLKLIWGGILLLLLMWRRKFYYLKISKEEIVFLLKKYLDELLGLEGEIRGHGRCLRQQRRTLYSSARAGFSFSSEGEEIKRRNKQRKE